jgi:glycosyltransferase involved in cell wall biosynthesis
MEQPLVSVVMGVYNPRNHEVFREAVESILNQSYRTLELLICDDGSDPAEAVYIQTLARVDSRIRLLKNRTRSGLAAALKRCVEAARGEFIARMDADDISAPERLEKQVELLEARPEIDWCGTNVWLFRGRYVWGLREYPELPLERDYLAYSPFVHPSIMFRAEMLKANNYMISPLTLRCEDYELFMRLQSKGYQGYNIQENLFFYREDETSYRKRSLRFRWNECKIRLRGFQQLGILLPFGWLYTLRPLVGEIIPNRLLAWVKRKESDEHGGELLRATGTTVAELSGAAAEKPGALSGVG